MNFEDTLILMQVYLSNIFDRLDLKATQTVLATVADNIVSGGRLAYCTLREPNKVHAPSHDTPMKMIHLTELSTELQKRGGKVH